VAEPHDDRQHHYELTVRWTGNRGHGTDGFRAYSRNHEVHAVGPPLILGSSDPAFRGDPERWNPEQLFLAAVSQCHMLWFLHLAAVAGVVVTDYEDRATAVMAEEPSGAGQFTGMTLHPRVTVVDPTQQALVGELHERAGSMCFLARSVNFPIHHDATVTTPASIPGGSG
jgi:organic hydroperoxide reductase OsmC/OhrA